jgi:hypothetical protein
LDRNSPTGLWLGRSQREGVRDVCAQIWGHDYGGRDRP